MGKLKIDKMKNIFYITMIACVLITTACTEDDTLNDQIESTTNLIGFVDASKNLSGLADGSEYIFSTTVYLFGPTADQITGSYTATLAVDPRSTAVEGVHFEFPSATVELNAANNYIASVDILMLTEGIEAPLDETPVLYLTIGAVSGAGNVIGSGKPLVASILYGCPSSLEGTYASIEHTWEPVCGGPSIPVEVTVTPVEGINGKYTVSDISDLYFGGNPCTPAAICGIIDDTCGVISVSNGDSGCNLGISVSGEGEVLEDGTIELAVFNSATASTQTIILQPI